MLCVAAFGPKAINLFFYPASKASRLNVSTGFKPTLTFVNKAFYFKASHFNLSCWRSLIRNWEYVRHRMSVSRSWCPMYGHYCGTNSVIPGQALHFLPLPPSLFCSYSSKTKERDPQKRVFFYNSASFSTLICSLTKSGSNPFQNKVIQKGSQVLKETRKKKYIAYRDDAFFISLLANY